MNRVTEETFERIIEPFQKSATIDLRATSFIDPYGMLGLLELGKVFKRGGSLPVLFVPESVEVLSYLNRMDFLKHAPRLFEIQPLHSGTGTHSRNPSKLGPISTSMTWATTPMVLRSDS